MGSWKDVELGLKEPKKRTRDKEDDDGWNGSSKDEAGMAGVVFYLVMCGNNPGEERLIGTEKRALQPVTKLLYVCLLLISYR